MAFFGKFHCYFFWQILIWKHGMLPHPILLSLPDQSIIAMELINMMDTIGTIDGAILQTNQKSLAKTQSYCIKMFLLLFCLVQYYNGICGCKYLLRQAVLLPLKSPWCQLMDFVDQSSWWLDWSKRPSISFMIISNHWDIPFLHQQKGTSNHCFHIFRCAGFYSTLSVCCTRDICAFPTLPICSRILMTFFLWDCITMTVQRLFLLLQKKCNNVPQW